jgi:hypothetical protein
MGTEVRYVTLYWWRYPVCCFIADVMLRINVAFSFPFLPAVSGVQSYYFTPPPSRLIYCNSDKSKLFPIQPIGHWCAKHTGDCEHASIFLNEPAVVKTYVLPYALTLDVCPFFIHLVSEGIEFIYLHNCPYGEEMSYVTVISYESKC